MTFTCYHYNLLVVSPASIFENVCLWDSRHVASENQLPCPLPCRAVVTFNCENTLKVLYSLVNLLMQETTGGSALGEEQ